MRQVLASSLQGMQDMGQGRCVRIERMIVRQDDGMKFAGCKICARWGGVGGGILLKGVTEFYT